MRLDKYLAHATGLSRKEVKRALHNKNVTVNSVITKDATYKVATDDTVEFQGQNISAPTHRYFMLNKPQGYVCSNDDPTHPTIAGLLSDEVRHGELNIAGRLDVDTTGLLLITTDGQWLHKITSPNYKQAKRYLVETADPIDVSAVDVFAEGILLKNEKHPTKPATLEILESHMAYLTLTEGKYHQVKRMFAAIGNKVTDLHRDQVGSIALDDSLGLGEYRELTAAEIEKAK
ncbi:MAG: 16S rRNA pseudouridine(516) synthase RsuA [Oceanospirillaceae bacterium]